jgi:hypothetical protein
MRLIAAYRRLVSGPIQQPSSPRVLSSRRVPRVVACPDGSALASSAGPSPGTGSSRGLTGQHATGQSPVELGPFPGSVARGLVVKANETPGEVPTNSTTQLRTTAPTVCGAPTAAVLRIVDAPGQCPCHLVTVRRAWREGIGHRTPPPPANLRGWAQVADPPAACLEGAAWRSPVGGPSHHRGAPNKDGQTAAPPP